MRPRFFISSGLLLLILIGSLFAVSRADDVCGQLCDSLDGVCRKAEIYPEQTDVFFSAFCGEYDRVRPFLAAVCMRRELMRADELILDIQSALSMGQPVSEILPMINDLKAAVYGVGSYQRLSAGTVF